MKIKNTDVSIEEAINFSKQNELLLKHRKNGILLSDYQVNVLKNNGFNYDKYTNIKELLFDIEEFLNTQYVFELDLLSEQIAELIYYRDTKK